MTNEESQFEILKKVQEGLLTPEEGSELLGILEGKRREPADESPEPKVDVVRSPLQAEKPEGSGVWRALWSIPMWLGVIITVLAAYGMYSGYEAAGFSWGFFLSSIPLVLGIVLVYAGARLLESRWMHIVVNSNEEGKREHIDIQVPFPISFLSWIVRTFGKHMSAEVRNSHLDEILDEIDASMDRNEPFEVHVDSDEDGKKIGVVIN